MKTFQEFITEAVGEYAFIKKVGFKADGKMSDGRDSYTHPAHGSIHINKHGEWHHIPHGSKLEDGFEGTNGATLKDHLDRVVK